MTATLRAREMIGSHDILFITLDTLRYDVACAALANGETPVLASILPNGEWQARHTPGSFTYAAHHAFFAGFLPTPITPGLHPRLMAARFAGSQSTDDATYVFDSPDIVSGLAQAGYLTICIGGVGFFNKQTPLSRVLPDLFDESYWGDDLGVTCKESTENQVALALRRMRELPDRQRLFLFINVSACHQPNRHYVPGADWDSPATQRAALAYVDRALAPLFEVMRERAPTLAIICSDHGTAYGEDGYDGHRLAHPVVWTVPYMETVLDRRKVAQ